MNRQKSSILLLPPLLFLLTVAVAAGLSPSPSGYGTHQALGLPPCLFLAMTGMLCPSCGLTTSFTALVHGQWRESFAAHPLGPIFFGMFAWWCLTCLLKYFGWAKSRRASTDAGRFLAAGLSLGVFLSVWFLRLYFHFSQGAL